jgi:hypothetical protein
MQKQFPVAQTRESTGFTQINTINPMRQGDEK